MKTPTLGFQDDVLLRKHEVAQVQLVEAIEMFLAGKFLPSLTLAGAAEGILAGLLNAMGKRSTAERAADHVESLRTIVKTPLAENPLARWNLARNQTKHHGKKLNEENRFSSPA